MTKLSDPTYLLQEQYSSASNLNARLQLHARFSVNEYDWFLWVFDQFDMLPQCRILELGCGPGDLWRKNIHRVSNGWDITLSDFSTGMLQQAQQNLRDCDHCFTFEIIDAQSIPFEDESFDAVIANHMIYHAPNRAQALGEMRRVLKPKGRLYATTVGAKHLSELQELLAKFDPGLAVRNTGEVNEFTLENGLAQLSKCFATVTLRRYEDAFLVTQAAPLVDYVMSGFWFSEGADRRGEFVEFVERELRLNEGVIRITKDSGMFLAQGG